MPGLEPPVRVRHDAERRPHQRPTTSWSTGRALREHRVVNGGTTPARFTPGDAGACLTPRRSMETVSAAPVSMSGGSVWASIGTISTGIPARRGEGYHLTEYPDSSTCAHPPGSISRALPRSEGGSGWIGSSIKVIVITGGGAGLGRLCGQPWRTRANIVVTDLIEQRAPGSPRRSRMQAASPPAPCRRHLSPTSRWRSISPSRLRGRLDVMFANAGARRRERRHRSRGSPRAVERRQRRRLLGRVFSAKQAPVMKRARRRNIVVTASPLTPIPASVPRRRESRCRGSPSSLHGVRLGPFRSE
jgi:hypothetical protein